MGLPTYGRQTNLQAGAEKGTVTSSKSHSVALSIDREMLHNKNI